MKTIKEFNKWVDGLHPVGESNARHLSVTGEEYVTIRVMGRTQAETIGECHRLLKWYLDRHVGTLYWRLKPSLERHPTLKHKFSCRVRVLKSDTRPLSAKAA